MPLLTYRKEPFLKRTARPSSSKIIFISCEGQVTEEEYFDMISKMFDGVKSKIRIISVMEEAVNTPLRLRTDEQKKELCKSKPWQLVEKIDKFKEKEKDVYDFENHGDDEFWIITDVDDNTNKNSIDNWNQMLIDCANKHYGYAISNPFFEVWLLLHHVEPNDNDYKYAVTEDHPYEKTSYFRERLRNDAHATLKDGKSILEKHYDISKVKKAIERAKSLHNEGEDWPRNLGSTVYLLLDEIVKISESVQN